MSFPEPKPGLVIRYSYLWEREALSGRDEGIKDRPCSVILVILREGKTPLVRVLPITHLAPGDPDDGLEIPQVAKLRLGLDGQRSWIIYTEANDFVWPGPDLRPESNGDPASAAFGYLPPGFMRELFRRLEARRKIKKMRSVARTV